MRRLARPGLEVFKSAFFVQKLYNTTKEVPTIVTAYLSDKPRQRTHIVPHSPEHNQKIIKTLLDTDPGTPYTEVSLKKGEILKGLNTAWLIEYTKPYTRPGTPLSVISKYVIEDRTNAIQEYAARKADFTLRKDVKAVGYNNTFFLDGSAVSMGKLRIATTVEGVTEDNEQGDPCAVKP